MAFPLDINNNLVRLANLLGVRASAASSPLSGTRRRRPASRRPTTLPSEIARELAAIGDKADSYCEEASNRKTRMFVFFLDVALASFSLAVSSC